MVKCYQYLGVLIENNLTCKLQTDKLSRLQNTFLNQLGTGQSHKIPNESRVVIWKSLFISKAFYGNLILARYSAEILEQLTASIYQSLRALFFIRSKPSKELLCKTVLGITGQEYIMAKTSNEEE